MAVYTELSDAFLALLVDLYPEAGDFIAAQGIAAGSINTMYRVTTTTGTFYLRVNENKERSDIHFEALLLDELAKVDDGVQAPHMVRNLVGGVLYPLQVHDESGPRPVGLTLEAPQGDIKYACLFRELRGRELAVFEVQPAHMRQLGRALAERHLRLQDFVGRENPFGVDTMRRWMGGLREQPSHAELDAVLREVGAARRPLPSGIIHGDLFRDNTKWRQGQLSAIFDWEMAGTDHLLLDIAIVVQAWCFDRVGASYQIASVKALLDGYQSVRSLCSDERAAFYDECRLAALRFCLSRIRDFELGPSPTLAGVRNIDGGRQGESDAAKVRVHLDYREYLSRLRTMEQMGRAAFNAMAISR